MLVALANDCDIRFVIISNLFYVVRGLGRRREFPRGGAVGVAPRHLDRLVTRYRMIYAAGPAANIVQATVACGAYMVFPDHLTYWQFVTALMASMSVVLGVSNLPLVRTELGMNADGGMIRLLGRRDGYGQRMVSLLTLGALAYQGQRPKIGVLS